MLCHISLSSGDHTPRTLFFLLTLDWLFGLLHSCHPRHCPLPCSCTSSVLNPLSPHSSSAAEKRGAGLKTSILISWQTMWVTNSGLEIIFFQNFEGISLVSSDYQLLLFLFQFFTRICSLSYLQEFLRYFYLWISKILWKCELVGFSFIRHLVGLPMWRFMSFRQFWKITFHSSFVHFPLCSLWTWIIPQIFKISSSIFLCLCSALGKIFLSLSSKLSIKIFNFVLIFFISKNHFSSSNFSFIFTYF